VLSAAMLGPWSAHAALFGDDEARRAILQLREQRTQDQEAMESLNRQVDQLKRSVLDLNTQIEQLKMDMARQRGQEELLQRELSEIQRRQSDLKGSLDERMSKLEPQSITLDGKTFLVDPEEKRLFDEAIARLRGADFAAAAVGFNTLFKQFPSTGYREAAWYWQGNAYYGLRDYKAAIAAFQQVPDKAPDHVKAPEGLLSVANCQVELQQTTAARKTLEHLIKHYPKAEAAQAARDRLMTLAPSAAGKRPAP
jgi:tol-pal system protein YbgF